MKVDNYASFLISVQTTRTEFYMERNKIFNKFLREIKRLKDIRGGSPESIVQIITEVNNKFNAFSKIINASLPMTFIQGEPYEEIILHNYFLSILKQGMPETFGIYQHYGPMFKNSKYNGLEVSEFEKITRFEKIKLFVTRVLKRKK